MINMSQRFHEIILKEVNRGPLTDLLSDQPFNLKIFRDIIMN